MPGRDVRSYCGRARGTDSGPGRVAGREAPASGQCCTGDVAVADSNYMHESLVGSIPPTCLSLNEDHDVIRMIGHEVRES